MYYLVTLYMYDHDDEEWAAGSRVAEAASAKAAQVIVSEQFRKAAASLNIEITSVSSRELSLDEIRSYLKMKRPAPPDENFIE